MHTYIQMYKPQIGTEILKRDQLYRTEIAIASCGYYSYHWQIDLKLKRSNVFVYIFGHRDSLTCSALPNPNIQIPSHFHNRI